MLVEVPTRAEAGPDPGHQQPQQPPEPVDLLILGAGWTWTFLGPLLRKEKVSHAATTTDGRGGTIAFRFDPDSRDPAEPSFARLPRARTVLVTFPLKGEGPARRLAELYAATHPSSGAGAGGEEKQQQQQQHRFILFGVTSVWGAPTWQDDRSPYDRSAARAVAEDELMAYCAGGGGEGGGCGGAAVLSLAGLYGASRQPRDWVDRVVRSRADLAAKGALHVVHGDDVARAVLALHRDFTPGARWMLTDLHVYDWWDLVQTFAAARLRDDADARSRAAAAADVPGSPPSPALLSPEAADRQRELIAWVGELMEEKQVRALPRDASSLGRALDGRNFWNRMRIWPSRGRVA